MSEKEMQELNPQIMTVFIGTRNLRGVKIYPLSVKDQLDMSDLITKALQQFFSSKEKSDIDFVAFLVTLIGDNLNKILRFVMDEEVFHDEILGEISNLQASEIAKIIYEVNYSAPSKNVKSLLEKLEILFQSGRQLQQSVKDTQDINSTISSENPLEKED